MLSHNCVRVAFRFRQPRIPELGTGGWPEPGQAPGVVPGCAGRAEGLGRVTGGEGAAGTGQLLLQASKTALLPAFEPGPAEPCAVGRPLRDARIWKTLVLEAPVGEGGGGD